MVARMPRDPQNDRVRLLAVELVGLQEELEDLEQGEITGKISGPIRRARLRGIVHRLQGARSRLSVTIEEDRA